MRRRSAAMPVLVALLFALLTALNFSSPAAASVAGQVHLCDYDLAVHSAPTCSEVASAVLQADAGETARSSLADGATSRRAPLVVAAEGEAAAGGLPFHDAALEARATSTIDDIEAGVTRYQRDGTVFR